MDFPVVSKKNILLILFLTLLFQKSFGTNPYKKNDILFVWAKNGSEIREKTSEISPKNILIKYGTRVTVIDGNLRKNAIELNIPSSDSNQNSFKISGFLIKVKTQTNEVGYIFDGFLSKMKPFKIKNNSFESEGEYLQRVYGKPVIHKITRKVEGYLKETYIYRNGIVSQIEQFDGCIDHTIQIPKISNREAYLYICIKQREQVIFREKKGNIHFFGDDSEISIRTQKHKIEISQGNCV